MEPYKLRRWKRQGQRGPGTLFTCARPGRSKGRTDLVPDKVVHAWVKKLPGGQRTVIVSLLGRKPDGQSEYSFYTFYGGFDLADDRPNSVHLREWLNRWHPEREFEVLEFPTIDFEPVPPTILSQLATKVNQLLDDGRTVVLVDSGGETRVRPVCAYLGLIEDTISYPE